MELSQTLQKEAVDFLMSIPNIHDGDTQRAIVYNAGLDSELQAQFSFGKSPAQFIPFLVSTLFKYGKLNNGQYALEVILEASKNYIGQDRRAYCDQLIDKIQRNRENDHRKPVNMPERNHSKSKIIARMSTKKAVLSVIGILLVVTIILSIKLLISNFMGMSKGDLVRLVYPPEKSIPGYAQIISINNINRSFTVRSLHNDSVYKLSREGFFLSSTNDYFSDTDKIRNLSLYKISSTQSFEESLSLAVDDVILCTFDHKQKIYGKILAIDIDEGTITLEAISEPAKYGSKFTISTKGVMVSSPSEEYEPGDKIQGIQKYAEVGSESF